MRTTLDDPVDENKIAAIVARVSLRAIASIQIDQLSQSNRFSQPPEVDRFVFAIFYSAFICYARIYAKNDKLSNDIIDSLRIKIRDHMGYYLYESAIVRDSLSAVVGGLRYVNILHTKKASISDAYEDISKISLNDSPETLNLRSAMKDAVIEDIRFLNNNHTTAELVRLPLWTVGAPSYWQNAWQSLKRSLDALGCGFEVWVRWYEGVVHGKGLDVDKTLLVSLLPPEVLAQDVAAINFRVHKLFDGAARRPLNRVRAIFIGHGDVGKTSLIRTLNGEMVSPGDSPMTRGVTIREVQDHNHQPNVDVIEAASKDNETTIHYWDFGGQIMVHQTHQFFLRSNCLYVLVVDGRRNEKINDDVRYWLEHVRAYGGSAPVMLVGNKVDLAPVQVDLTTVKMVFPNVLDFYPLSCTLAHAKYAPEFQRFQRDFYATIQEDALNRQVFLTEEEFVLLEATRSAARLQSFLPKAMFKKMYASAHLGDYRAMGSETLLELFDKLGIVINFPNFPPLSEVLINPEWLTRGIFEIMYDGGIGKNGGICKQNEIISLLSRANLYDQHGTRLTYSEEQAKFIMGAMKEFKLAFSPKQEVDVLVIPALLGSSRPNLTTSAGEPLTLRVRFEGFMPPHILPTIMAESYDEIVHNEFWQYGVHLASSSMDANALIEKDEHTRTINFSVVGEDASEFLGVMRERLSRSYRSVQHVIVREEVLLTQKMLWRRDGRSAPEGVPDSWESYVQLRGALARPDYPFVGSNGIEYDLRTIHQSLPTNSDAEKALQILDSVYVGELTDDDVRRIGRTLDEVRNFVHVHKELKIKPDAATVRDVQATIQKIIARADGYGRALEKVNKHLGGAETFLKRISKILDLIGEIFS